MRKETYLFYRDCCSLKKCTEDELKTQKKQAVIERLSARVADSIARRELRLKKRPKVIYNESLPVADRKDEIIDAIKKNQVVIISGETGSGKTTQLPKFCIDAGRGIDGVIGCTQPRRIAAVTVAARIAAGAPAVPGLKETDRSRGTGMTSTLAFSGATFGMERRFIDVLMSYHLPESSPVLHADTSSLTVSILSILLFRH